MSQHISLCLSSFETVSVPYIQALSVSILKRVQPVGLEEVTLNTAIFPGPAPSLERNAASLFLTRSAGCTAQNQVQHQGKKHQPIHILDVPGCTLLTGTVEVSQLFPTLVLQAPP